jgi:LysR family transcriptional regulator, carnitine catabolism transcriptional activator
MKLTFRQFEILLAAAEAESFSDAAQRLKISQPSLSESIRRIEQELGARLFDRTTRSLRLTAHGRHAATVAREAVRDFRRSLDRLAQAGRQERITVAALPSIVCSVLPVALQAFARDRSAVDIGLHDVQHERAVGLVMDGVADIAVTIKPAQREDLHFQEVTSDLAHLVCRKDDPLARRKQVRWQELDGRPFIGITRTSSVRRLTDAAFVQAETALAPRFELEQILSAIAMVEAGFGITALPSFTFAMFKGRDLVVRPLVEPRVRRNVGFVTHAARTLPPHAEALMRAIRASLLRVTKSAPT